MLDSADFYTYDPKKFPFQSTLNEKQHTPNVQHARGETYFGYHISCSEAMDGIPPYENQKIFFMGRLPHLKSGSLLSTLSLTICEKMINISHFFFRMDGCDHYG